MYELMVDAYFSAAHQLRECGSGCEQLHGHNWRVQVVVRGEDLGKGGILMDFRILKEEVAEVLAQLDHHYLNEIPYFQREEPSSENIARFIYEALEKRLLPYGQRPYKVTAWESAEAAASYYKEDG